ncbi:MAG: phospholipid carrier-dependent glycosyltransferase [Cyanobacteria bacterium P01_A01_bin.114]
MTKAVFKPYFKPYSKLIGVSVVALGLLAGFLRFWHLGRFNTFVFDEVYFAHFAYQYWQSEPVFDVHPPLGKYLIALGMALAHQLPMLAKITHTELGVPLSTLSYRWVNALIGTLTPLLVAGMAWELGGSLAAPRRGWFTLLSGSFVAIDGLFIVESRYALINIHLVFWGCLGHWLWLRSGRKPGQSFGQAARQKAGQTLGLKYLAGIALGACISTKWNGLPWLVGLVATPLRRRWPLYIVGIPIAIYGLLWIPHLRLSGDTLLLVHQSILSFHLGMETGAHPYCSAWYTWPLLIRPIAYWYQVAEDGRVFDIHGLGNPILWWLSLGAMTVLGLRRIWATQPDSETSPETYLVLNYAINWLPWVLVSRCTFLYHYLSAALFSFMGLAWLISGWFTSERPAWQWMAGGMVGAIALAGWFWLPLALGLPLTEEALQRRFWLSSWL